MNSGTSFQFKQESLSPLEKDRHFLSGPFAPQSNEFYLPPLTKLLDRFEIKRHIANGRGSGIYLADDLLETTEVILKFVDAGPLNEEWKTSRLQREIKISRMISNFDHVIRIYDIHAVPFEGTILLFLSMEYADGKSLREWLDENKEDPQQRRSVGLTYFLQVCQGLSHIHDIGITHLDIKPENMLFLNSILKISDLGAAIVPGLFEEAKQPGKGVGLCDCGTPRYMSPEQFIASHPNDVDAKSDIYSLGIILYEILHPECRPPFSGSYSRLRELHLEVPAPKISKAGEKLGGIIACCLEKDPAKRYQTVDELIDVFAGKSPVKFKSKNSKEIERKKNVGLLKKTWEKASHCYAKGNFNEAAALIDEVLSTLPAHTQARRLKEELSNRFAQSERFYQEISINLEGDLSELIELLEGAISIYPDHPLGQLIQAKLAARVRHYRKAMEEGLNALQKEHWKTALVWFRKAFQVHPETPCLSQIIENLDQINNNRCAMDTAVQQGNFDTALCLSRLVDERVEEMKDRIPVLRESKVYEDTKSHK